jgi:fluoride ion exporter CrcB/FEX
LGFGLLGQGVLSTLEASNIPCMPDQNISSVFSASSCKARSSSGVTDVLGSYTTFSSMQLDAARLAATQHAHLAVFYLFLSIAAGLVAALAGAALAYVQGGS